MALSYALTTVARTKTFLGISVATYDTVLDYLVDSATEFIENYCDRRFMQTAYSNEEYNGNDTRKLLLKNYPVASGSTFTLDRRDNIDNRANWTEIDSEDYFVHWDEGIVELVGSRFYQYPRHYRVTYTAGINFDNAATFLTDAGGGDLEMACWKLVGQVFNTREIADNVRSESLGEYSVTFARELELSPEIKMILDKYKRPYGN